MKSVELRSRFLKFFEKRGHAIIPSASLVPENDPTVLFNTAGMQPLAPYLLGVKHPKGDRLADVQKCVRTTDIDDIGDKTHATFFEMLGNWSLGHYFKEDAIKWSYEFLTSNDEGLGLDPNRLYITVFSGNENSPRDDESARAWQEVGIPANRIFYKGEDSNWWPAVKGKDTWTGPTGPSSEMFYDVSGNVGELATVEDFIKAEDEQRIVEIWNDVFMEFEKKEGKILGRLSQKNVDTGAGLERILMVMQGVDNIFGTDVFEKIMTSAGKLSNNLRSQRIIADHMRTSIFLITDGVVPSNTDRGYVLRRLIRRAIFHTDRKDLDGASVLELVNAVALTYSDQYPEIKEKSPIINRVISDESEKFRKTLREGLKQFEKISTKDNSALGASQISGKDAFMLFTTYGFPVEMTAELAYEKGTSIDMVAFDNEMNEHQKLSRAGSEQKFKGGLADTSEMSVKYHTATHLLNAALKNVLGDHVMQKGSNITTDRLRFDFTHPTKMTDDEKKRVEDIVNIKIDEALPVSFEEMALDKAREIGAVGVFGEKYADVVKVYTIGNDETGIFSREICGGPHVKNTSELGHFKIQKEEAVSAGVRRIKAVLTF